MIAVYSVIAWLALLGSAIGLNFKSLHRPVIQPVGEAFAIWWVIYACLLAVSIRGTAPLLIPSIAFVVGWSVALRMKALKSSAAALASAAAVAWIALARSAPVSIESIGIGVFAGWLTVASVLAGLISVRADGHPILLLALTIFTAVASIVLRRAAPMLSVLWACLLQSSASAPQIAASVTATGALLASGWLELIGDGTR